MAKAPKPRILIVTPEITYLPEGMGNMANYLTAKAGGLADVSAALVASLYEAGVDVHVALPNYRTMFNRNIGSFISKELSIMRAKLPGDRIHLAEDRCFYYREQVYHSQALENMKLSLAFQREVINNILPRVKPDLIHCNDWMTGLLPAIAKRLGIASLFTLHNIHSLRTNLEHIEESGIDAAQFWPYLFFDRPPINYEETRSKNRVDFLVSAVFASSFVNTVSPTFLKEIVRGQHPFVSQTLQQEMVRKVEANCAAGVLNSPDPSFQPHEDTHLLQRYTSEDHWKGKTHNKLYLQKVLGLIKDPDAPLFFWPSRMDPVQKGCQLLADIFLDVINRYSSERLQVLMVANGPAQRTFHEIVQRFDLRHRVSVCDFDEKLSHLGYAAADYIFMPSSFEPCGLPQMIGPIYGALPVAHDTGGIHDTVVPLSVKQNKGNGFLFEIHDSTGLRWAIDQAMKFHRLPKPLKNAQISRIMRESAKRFNQNVTAQHYMAIYKQLLHSRLVKK